MDGLAEATNFLFSLQGILLVVVGTILGIIVGAIPGLTGAMLISLTLPLTFSMNPVAAFVLLISMYVGAVSGGLITATLLRMPGTPASIMTTLDGYPMAKSGKPGRALGLGITASFVGGFVSWLFLITLSAPIALYSTRLGAFDFFALILMALVLIASVGGKSLSRSFFSAFCGILATLPGIDTATGNLRLTFGFEELNGGLKLLPVLIGLFAISQVISDIRQIEEKIEVIPIHKRGDMFFKLKDWKDQAINLLRSSVIGTWVGILPGVGANIGSVAAYSAAKSMAKAEEKDMFGKGAESAIVASESANNATIGGALIPLISLGIPGSVIDAILLGALLVHGLQPGPLLFQQNPTMVYTIMGTMIVANFFMFFFMIFAVKYLARLSMIPRGFLMPVILVFCIVGSFALSTRMFDVWTMIVFGLLGFAFEHFKIPLAPFVIGFVLAPVAEENLLTGLMASNGSFLPLVTRPIALLFVSISIVLIIVPIFRRYQSGSAS
ncbi:MAG: tripartite tricarboxylate transporter permease [Verrucomicrobia bacterium]|nr:tripartite tricarboxylate transporter permease [Verrucomicrobiota bacterium]MDA1066250.1 tripartite tricarboxylate transporter permease [Verrucomicrobiota bacterium]